MKKILLLLVICLVIFFSFQLTGCGTNNSNELAKLGATGRGHTLGPGNLETDAQIQEYLEEVDLDSYE